MPKPLAARLPHDALEERQVRKLSHSVHAPADWILHAQMVARSWDGLRTRQIAAELGCHPETVRTRLQAFNERGLDGLGLQPGSGRTPRLTEHERSAILALVKLPPPGKPTYERTGELAAPDPDPRGRGRAGVDAGYLDRRGPGAWDGSGTQPGTAHLRSGARTLAAHAAVGHQQGS
jgi:Homeodomain-like domain-containing protein